jgi:hypothetical protein
VHRSERALFDHLIGESTRVLAPPLAHGTDDRAEVATLCGENVLGPRGKTVVVVGAGSPERAMPSSEVAAPER